MLDGFIIFVFYLLSIGHHAYTRLSKSAPTILPPPEPLFLDFRRGRTDSARGHCSKWKASASHTRIEGDPPGYTWLVLELPRSCVYSENKRVFESMHRSKNAQREASFVNSHNSDQSVSSKVCERKRKIISGSQEEALSTCGIPATSRFQSI